MQSIWSTLNAIWNEACLHSLASVALSVSISPFLSLFPCLWTAASQAIAKSLFSCSHSWFQLPSFATIIQHCCHTECVCVCVPQTHITSHTTVRSQSVSQSVASSSSWPTEDHQRKCSSPFLVHFLKVRTFPFGINDSPTRTDDTPPVSVPTVVPTVSF